MRKIFRQPDMDLSFIDGTTMRRRAD